MNTWLLTDCKWYCKSWEAATMQKSGWLADKRMQIKQNWISLMGKALDCCFAIVLPVWRKSITIFLYTAPNILCTSQQSERWICHSWKVILLISFHSLDECMLMSKIARRKPKRPQNHFSFSQRNESWCACHVLWRMHRCFLTGGFSVSKQEAWLLTYPHTQTHTI